MSEYIKIDYMSALWFPGFESFRRVKTGSPVGGHRPNGEVYHGVVVCLVDTSVTFVLDVGNPSEVEKFVRKFPFVDNVGYLRGVVAEFYDSGPCVGCGPSCGHASLAVDSLGRCVGVVKAVCSDCRYLVAVIQHSQSCEVVQSSALHSVVDRVRRLAWLGDALHTADVRCSLLSEGVPSSELQLRLQFLCSTGAQAAWYKRSLEGLGASPSVKPLGSSDRQVADAFEASYVDGFRALYCRDVLHLTNVPDLVSEFRKLHSD